MKFKIISSFKPTGDQPEAIDQICEGLITTSIIKPSGVLALEKHLQLQM